MCDVLVYQTMAALTVCTPPRLGEKSPSSSYHAENSPRTVRLPHNLSPAKQRTNPVSETNYIQAKSNSDGKTASNEPSLKFRERSNINIGKRSGSFSLRDGRPQFKKRRKADNIVLPTKFLLGGNIRDPLNLASLTGDKIQVTPCSSPMPTPQHKKEVEVLIPANINDPLNLNSKGSRDSDVPSTISLGMSSKINSNKLRSRKGRKRKRTDSETTIDGDDATETAKEETNGTATKEDAVVPLVSTSANSEGKLDTQTLLPPTNELKLATQSNDPKVAKLTPPKPADCGSSNASSEMEKSINNTTNEAQSQKRYKPKNERFQYGNYNRYYGYRNKNNDMDLRLKQMNREWFYGKSVLDIGCNSGHVTLAIAKNFSPVAIKGIDIDGKLIEIARKNVRHYADRIKTQKSDKPTLDNEVEPAGSGDHAAKEENVEPSSVDTTLLHEPPHNVTFNNENYVLANDELLQDQTALYDCIICLSVSKWIHLNWGDDGLKRVFKRVFRQLRPGGRFIFEPQPWVSYKKKHSLTERIDNNYKSISFKPENFNSYLLSPEVGFTTSDLIGTPDHESKGFKRPIYMFVKEGTSS